MAKRLSILLLFLLFLPAAQAGAFVGLEVGKKIFRANEKTDASSDVAASSGAFVTPDVYGLVLGYKGEDQRISKHFLWNLDISASQFSANKQEVPRLPKPGGETASYYDLGTNVDSQVFSITGGLLFVSSAKKTGYFFVGVGAGLGYMTAKGEIYLTEDSTDTACADAEAVDEIQENCELLQMEVSGFGLATSVHYGYRGDGWWFKMGNRAPSITFEEMIYSSEALTMELSVEF